jgi:Sulfotransferase family
VSPDPAVSRGPVVVLTYAHAGAEELQRALAASRSLACTSGTGLLPLCQAAITAWQQAESRDTPSPLAVKSVRTLLSTITAVIQAREGATRLCETAIAAPAAAATFARVFPEATFVCLHRGFPGVLAAGLSAYPFGLGNSPFWPYSGPHPGNSIATIAAYWAARTQALLEFEAHHAGSSCRVRYEDLTADPVAQASVIYARLGLDATELAVLRLPHDQAASAIAAASSASSADLENSIPPELRAIVDRLSERLGYSALPYLAR